MECACVHQMSRVFALCMECACVHYRCPEYWRPAWSARVDTTDVECWGGWMFFSFFDSSSSFCYWLIEFHCIFSTSYVQVSRRDFFFARCSILTPLFCFIVLFHSCCSRAWVHISCSHTEWYFIFSDSKLPVHERRPRLDSLVGRDGHELLWNVINYITNYMLKIVFWLHYQLQQKNAINITITI